MSPLDEAFPSDRYRPLLRLLVRKLGIEQKFGRRFDSSDLIQETLLKAHQGWRQFRGQSEGELLAWLHQILLRVAADQLRRATAGKRDIALERSLDEWLAEASSATRTLIEPPASGLSPSGQAQHHENLLRLAAAIEQLAEDQQFVLVERDLNSRPIQEIALQMDRSEKAVAGLLLRARKRLRELLDAPS